jgi:hypothetical protein
VQLEGLGKLKNPGASLEIDSRLIAKCPGNRVVQPASFGNRGEVSEVHGASCDMLTSLLFSFRSGDGNVANSSKRKGVSCN